MMMINPCNRCKKDDTCSLMTSLVNKRVLKASPWKIDEFIREHSANIVVTHADKDLIELECPDFEDIKPEDRRFHYT